ncbi:MAG: cell division protein FtsX, partial [Clostridiales bacterium]
MNMLESARVAISAIWSNKMRSILTMLGIIIGISSVITVFTLGKGGRTAIGQEFESFGVARVFIGMNWSENPQSGDIMNHSDIDALARTFSDEIYAISPRYTTSGEISMNRKNENVYVSGVNEQYNRIEKNEIIKGRYLIESDINAAREVALIDSSMAMELFGRLDVLGERITVRTRNRNISLLVVGVFEEKKGLISNLGIDDPPRYVYIPISAAERIFGIGDRIYGIDMNLQQDVDVQSVLDRMTSMVERRHRNSGEEKYRGYSAESEMETVGRITGIISAVVSSIAAISLVVGGIGVMNIMLVSVTERTREIGIRKAIGARRRDILLQFLVEAVIISGMGGIIGTAFGIGISFAISAFIKITPGVSISTILIAWLFSAGVGIFFGIYPANKAAK